MGGPPRNPYEYSIGLSMKDTHPHNDSPHPTPLGTHTHTHTHKLNIYNTAIALGTLGNGTAAAVVAFEIADSSTPGNWQTFFAATTQAPDPANGGALLGWSVLDRTEYADES